MSDFKKDSDKELAEKLDAIKAELEERHKVKVAAEMKVNEGRLLQITREGVNQFFPEHGRTSCSDSNVVNGFESSPSGIPRCNRCALLEIVDGIHYLEMKMVAYISWEKIE